MAEEKSKFRTSKDLSFMRRARRLCDDGLIDASAPLKATTVHYSLNLDEVSGRTSTSRYHVGLLQRKTEMRKISTYF